MCYPPQDYVGTIPADTRGRTIVVAASNSIDPTLAPAAYRCDGVADQVEINAAITALGAIGGTVILLEGTYNITASINLASNVTLIGQGAGTVLKIPNAFNANLNVISASSKNRVLVADLKIDGNKANQGSFGQFNYGIYFNTVTHSKVVHCWVEDMCNDGITLDTSDNNTITGNTCQSNRTHGIYLFASNNNTIMGNNCQSTDMGAGLYLDTDSNNNTIMGNNCQNNGDVGIGLGGCSNNTITGNTCQGNSYEGICLTLANNNTITGNTVIGNSQDADNTYDGIIIGYDSDYNNVGENTVRHAGGAKQHRYGINIETVDCDGSLVINNDLYLAGKTADYGNAGTGTIYHNNRTTAGWVA